MAKNKKPIINKNLENLDNSLKNLNRIMGTAQDGLNNFEKQTTKFTEGINDFERELNKVTKPLTDGVKKEYKKFMMIQGKLKKIYQQIRFFDLIHSNPENGVKKLHYIINTEGSDSLKNEHQALVITADNTINGSTMSYDYNFNSAITKSLGLNYDNRILMLAVKYSLVDEFFSDINSSVIYIYPQVLNLLPIVNLNLDSGDNYIIDIDRNTILSDQAKESKADYKKTLKTISKLINTNDSIDNSNATVITFGENRNSERYKDGSQIIVNILRLAKMDYGEESFVGLESTTRVFNKETSKEVVAFAKNTSLILSKTEYDRLIAFTKANQADPTKLNKQLQEELSKQTQAINDELAKDVKEQVKEKLSKVEAKKQTK